MFDEKNVETYIFIVVKSDGEKEVLHDLMKIEGVAEPSLVYGDYDIYYRLNGASMEKLMEVHDKVRKLRILVIQTLITQKKAEEMD